MSTNDDTPERLDETPGPETRRRADDHDCHPGRYTALEAEDGVLVIFDRENPDAWIQSDHAVALDPVDE